MRKLSLIFLTIILFTAACAAQTDDTLYISFWNLQNLFDVIDDPEKNDEEYLPDSEIEWTAERLDKKMYNLSRVIRSMNNEQGPDILGVCEVENRQVLEMMVQKYLSDFNYGTAYLESPDNRGIDNGLIFKQDKFKLLNVQADTVHLSDNWPTRLIFGANLLIKNKQQITVFVNHWPSRRGGLEKSEPNRIAAAQTLHNAVQRIFANDEDAKIFIIGDFNDEPTNNSILNYLKAEPIFCDSANTVPLIEDKEGNLFNISYKAYNDGLGSYKYRNDWNMLDQIIVSRDILIGKSIIYICGSFNVYKPYFLETHSGKYKGTPFPTYGGKRYLGGYSDHFPVIAKFIIRTNE